MRATSRAATNRLDELVLQRGARPRQLAELRVRLAAGQRRRARARRARPRPATNTFIYCLITTNNSTSTFKYNLLVNIFYLFIA